MIKSLRKKSIRYSKMRSCEMVELLGKQKINNILKNEEL